MSGVDIVSIVFALLWVVLISGVGARLTQLGEWYYALDKPPWQPPDWLFPIAWTSIFLLSAAALLLAWNDGAATDATRRWLMAAFTLNALLNALWSMLFFRMRRPDLALVEVLPLWISIAAMMAAVAQTSWPGVVLIAPYLVWVSFAAVLNRSVVQRNRPFTST